jgi:cysteine desulfuration protein SufE
LTQNRFGTEIKPEDILEALAFFDAWEDRYKYIIDLGRELPALAAQYRTEENLVRGCQSQVWLLSRQSEGKLYFEADSDAFIVKGLLGVVLAAYNGRSPAEILAFDIGAYFERLNLLKHLSATRGNGLQAMVQRIKAIAAAQQET